MLDENEGTEMGQVIRIDEGRIKDHLGEMVRGTVEEALNALLDAEADRLCGAGRYERTKGRQDTRAGSYERSLHTKAGAVELKVPKLRRQRPALHAKIGKSLKSIKSLFSSEMLSECFGKVRQGKETCTRFQGCIGKSRRPATTETITASFRFCRTVSDPS